MISLIDILKIHKKVIEYDKEKDPDDYTPEIRSLATLELMFSYMLKESNSVFENAAILVYVIVSRHPFYNGNKRTGFEAMNFIIEDAGYKFNVPNQEMINFIMFIATENNINIQEIETWIIEHTI
jgi:death-on-curing protein